MSEREREDPSLGVHRRVDCACRLMTLLCLCVIQISGRSGKTIKLARVGLKRIEKVDLSFNGN
jgi:hypothetical protein